MLPLAALRYVRPLVGCLEQWRLQIVRDGCYVICDVAHGLVGGRRRNGSFATPACKHFRWLTFLMVDNCC